MRLFFGLLFFWLSFSTQAWGQVVADTVLERRWQRFSGAMLAGYGLGMYGLDRLWYAQEGRGRFHFFDDSRQWQQMDKFGHSYTSYQIGRVAHHSLLQSGVAPNKALWWGGGMGFLMLLPIEILDGFSPTYGASWSDLVANGLGSALFISQESLWGKQRLLMKFSYRPTLYAPLRPNMLGNNHLQRLLKDYNGQRYWFSVAPLPTHKRLSFVAFSVGYGAENMLFGSPTDNLEAGYEGYRRYHFSIDIDWQRIKTRRRSLKTLFFFLNCVKMPAPTLYWDKHQKWQASFLHF
jgi:hypothetical protein